MTALISNAKTPRGLGEGNKVASEVDVDSSHQLWDARMPSMPCSASLARGWSYAHRMVSRRKKRQYPNCAVSPSDMRYPQASSQESKMDFTEETTLIEI